MKSKHPDYSTPYCLHCYAPLEEFRGASTACSSCGEPNLRVDLQRLWTRERRLREVEDLLKVLVCLAMGAIAAFALLNPGMGVGRGHGMAIGGPIVMGVLLWDLASITRRRTLFRSDIVWPIIGWLLGLPFVWMVLVVGDEVATPVRYALLVSGIALTLPAMASPLLRRGWSRWRDGHIARGQLRAGH